LPATGEIDLQVAALEDRVTTVALGCRKMPQNDTDAGEKLVDAEGLGEVVVGASVQGDHLVLLPSSRRDDDDRDG
jgi:hypothetical protein